MLYNKWFYGIFGIEGCGVYTSYKKAIRSKLDLKRFKIKRFKIYREAEWFAIDGFAEYVYERHYFADREIPQKLILNRTIYPKKKKLSNQISQQPINKIG